MKIGKIIPHVCIVLIGVLVLLGGPFMTTEKFAAIVSGDTDTVSSASVIIDAPSGDYIIYINTRYHQDEESLELWKDFFSGGETPILFEDVDCSAALGDSGAMTLADSFRSRLPENQMIVTNEEAALLFSRADHGKFDILIVSKEFAEAYKVDLEEDGVIAVEFKEAAA